jgi:hypothetical protein
MLFVQKKKKEKEKEKRERERERKQGWVVLRGVTIVMATI